MRGHGTGTGRGIRGIAIAACTALVLSSACAEEKLPLPRDGRTLVQERGGKRVLVSMGLVMGEVWDGREKSLYSQGNEELIIQDFFQGKTHGSFLDVGAANATARSTTYYLENHRAWSGIAIDALSEYAADYAKVRPRTRFFSYIVTDHSGTRQKFYRVHAAPSLSSTSEAREWDGVKLPAKARNVPTITLDELLAREQVARIDFLSMDIEGGEAMALAGFDIERYRPELVCIEVAPEHDVVVESYFSERGYARIEKYRKYDHVNRYYTPLPREPDGTHD